MIGLFCSIKSNTSSLKIFIHKGAPFFPFNYIEEKSTLKKSKTKSSSERQTTFMFVSSPLSVLATIAV